MRSFIVKYILGVVVIINSAAFAFTQNRNANAVDFEKELINNQSEIWRNPAMLSHKYDKSFSDISLSLQENKSNGLYIIELGDKNSAINFDAYSFKKRKQSSVFGRAKYIKSHTENIKWNTVSDYYRLYPFIVADTIGGKSYKEHYYFEGIYNYESENYTIGIQGKYKATEEYRKLDPRPKSTVSDVTINIGVLKKISKKYKIGANFSFADYQQDQDIDVYKTGAGIKIYYLRGMGVSDKEFSTPVKSNDPKYNTYELKSYEIGTQLIPVDDKGFFSSVSYQKSELELADILYKINHMNSKTLNLSLGRLFKPNGRFLKLKSYFKYLSQKGFDHSYKDFKLINVTQKYTADKFKLGIDGILFYKKEHRSTFYHLNVNYSYSNEERWILTGQKPLQELNHLNLNLGLGKRFVLKKSSLNLKLFSLANYCLNSDLITTNVASEGANEGLITPNYKFLSADKLILGTDIRYDIGTKKSYGLYTRLEYNQMIISGSKSQYGFNLAIGLTL
ncbi:DUF6850 family outer membrane beta-barrel protein [Marinifilum caeruleilacunae]|uniref:DUF6850 domain-containing protein n=1 Tax=Marinifilum caeruleilacunae TaxID=2499076 RepID=A0ABX1WQV5_9BACT|nr:DUF6850 family outer membrane beta-barrel protein [Marinifilum caeruleilacunae]NOU58381.1 hypothetical protein [Marinifilum caeruleilacunae]